MLDVELLGHLRLSHDGRPVVGVRNPRLVAYLLLHRDHPRTRDEVAFALWPDSGDAQALTNLRREIHILRYALPEPNRLLDLEGRAIQWRPDGPFRLDVAEFETAMDRGRRGDPDGLRTAIARYGGDLVPGIYDDWIAPHRDRLRNLHLEAIAALAARQEERREYREAIELLRQLIELDPLQESAYRSLMRVAVLSGDRSAGLRAYHACATALQTELGVQPAAETRTAYEQLLTLDRGEPGQVTIPQAQPTHRFVGRDMEWTTLTSSWVQARSGAPTLALIQGEAGMGKSRLLEELLRWTRAQGHAAVYTRSYAAEGALAYAPVAAWLRAEPIRTAIGRLDGAWLTEIARLLPELVSEYPDLRPPEPMTESWQRQRLFEALARVIRATGSPLLLVLDDAHWADHDTLEWLHYILRADPPTPLLVVIAARIEELTANAALMALVLDMRQRAELVEVELGALSEEETADLGADVADRSLDVSERIALYKETDGHPLVVVELARGGMASLGQDAGPIAAGEPEDRATFGQRIPPRMRAVIAARLEQLTPELHQLLDLAATFGRDFSFEALAIASDLEEKTLARALDALWQRRIVRDRGLNTYDVSHDRIRDVAYADISPPRRRLLHRRVAQALELVHANDLDSVAAQLAAHLDAAGQPMRAIEMYERAALVSSRISANADAARQLLRALTLLREAPASVERDGRELDLLFRLSRALLAIEGYASGRQEQTLERAWWLAETLGRRRDMILALSGLSGVRVVGGEVRRSLELAEIALELVTLEPDGAAASHFAAGGALMFLGEPARAVGQFEKSVASFRPGRSLPMASGADVAVFACSWGSHALWVRGETGRAVDWSVEAVDRADVLEHPYARTIAHAYAAILSQLRGEDARMLEHATVANELCTRYQFAYYGAWYRILRAWAARASSPDSAERIEQALGELAAIKAIARRPYYLSLLADVHLATGNVEAAREALQAALETATGSQEQWWVPEIHRQLGELETGDGAEGELRRALEMADGQGSRALALRAALSLARRTPTARPLLTRVLRDVPDPGRRERAEALALLRAPVASA